MARSVGIAAIHREGSIPTGCTSLVGLKRNELCEVQIMGWNDGMHCDDHIDNPETPEVLNVWLKFARSPGHGLQLPEPHPRLFADYEGERVRLTMASRLGDVGITQRLDAEFGYELRVMLDALTNFSENP